MVLARSILTGATSEIKEIASVSGNTITFTSPLSISYRTSHTAQLTRYTLTGGRPAATAFTSPTLAWRI